MIPRKNDVWMAFEILSNIRFSKRKDIPAKINEAQEIIADSCGIAILPAPKWTVDSNAYKPIENINYIDLFIGSVAGDIRTYANETECEALWLKSIGKEWLIEQYKDRMLTTFDYAYKKWRERQ